MKDGQEKFNAMLILMTGILLGAGIITVFFSLMMAIGVLTIV